MMETAAIVLDAPNQRLALAPQLGGAITRWDWRNPQGVTPLMRAWDGCSEDRYTMACFPLVPWSNRITRGGFDQDGVFHRVAPNRAGEAFPIHGDGWLQPWELSSSSAQHAQLELESRHFRGSPYAFRSTQVFQLLPDGLAIELAVTHLGDRPLPYGLGLHPYFMRDRHTRLRMHAAGIWLSGDDPIPVAHSTEFPPTADYNVPAPLEGPLLDHCYSGWDGEALIEYPAQKLSLRMRMEDCNGYSLLYRPPDLPYFCLEPITHPIDAFHMPGRPGLRTLSTGQSMRLRATLTVAALDV